MLLETLLSTKSQKNLTAYFLEHLAQLQRHFQTAFQNTSYDLQSEHFIDEMAKISDFFMGLYETGVSNVTFAQLEQAGLNKEILQKLLDKQDISLNFPEIQQVAIYSSDFVKFHKHLPRIHDSIISPEKLGLDTNEKVQAFKNLFKLDHFNSLTEKQANKIIEELNNAEKYLNFSKEKRLPISFYEFEITSEDLTPEIKEEIDQLIKGEKIAESLKKNGIDPISLKRNFIHATKNYYEFISNNQEEIDKWLNERYRLSPDKTHALHLLLKIQKNIIDHIEKANYGYNGIEELIERLENYNDNTPLLKELGIKTEKDAKNLLSILQLCYKLNNKDWIEKLLEQTSTNVAKNGITPENTYFIAKALDLTPESLLRRIDQFQTTFERTNVENVSPNQIPDKILDIADTLYDPKKSDPLMIKIGGASHQTIETIRDIIDLHNLTQSYKTGFESLVNILDSINWNEPNNRVSFSLNGLNITNPDAVRGIKTMLDAYKQIEPHLNHIGQNGIYQLSGYMSSTDKIVYTRNIAELLEIDINTLEKAITDFAKSQKQDNTSVLTISDIIMRLENNKDSIRVYRAPHNPNESIITTDDRGGNHHPKTIPSILRSIFRSIIRAAYTDRPNGPPIQSGRQQDTQPFREH